MRKFYNEPEMAVKRFEAENIVTIASEIQTNGNADLTSGYAIANGTLKRDDATGIVDLSFQ